DGDHEVSWADENGNPLIDADGDGIVDPEETAELSEDAVGLAITDLDFGVVVMVCIDPTDLGAFVAMDVDLYSFEFVGVPGLTATGTLSVELNVGLDLGFSIIESGPIQVVDFISSFPAEVDWDYDGNPDVNEILPVVDVNGDGEVLVGTGADADYGPGTWA
ncbi:MAG: hypothetical protein GTN93_12810, partial [Anaerolineae bacterium]|nr:hypothetical protein [Anaerolineae bacterium]